MNISGVSSVSQNTIPSVRIQESTPPVVPADSSSKTTVKPSQSSITEAVQSLNNFVNTNNTSISFYIDNSTEKVVIKIMDTKNLQLICQMPTEQALAMAQALKENENKIPTGLMVKNQV